MSVRKVAVRPSLLEGRIRLTFARPELLRRSRLGLPGMGDSIPAQTGVHPWLAADAIRWYADHPEDRSAMGTEAEHTRLLAALTAGAYGVGPPPAPEIPAPVRIAIRPGSAGIVFGLLTASTDAVLTFALQDRLKAAAIEAGEQRVREYGDRLVAIRTLQRGSEVGRIGLIALSAVAAVWAVMPCFDLASEALPGLEPLLIVMSGLKRLGYLGLGTAVLRATRRSFTFPVSISLGRWTSAFDRLAGVVPYVA